MNKTSSGVASVANALAVMALRAERSRQVRDQQEQARRLNRAFEAELALRSLPVRRAAEHTRMPFILMAGRPEEGGIGFAGSPGGQPVVQGAPRALQGSDVPLGYDEGMVRLASAIGADLALMSQKNAAFNLGAIGTTLSKGVGRVGGALGTARTAISSGASRAMGAVRNTASQVRSAVGGVFKPPAPPKIQAPTPHVAPGVGAPRSSAVPATPRVNTGTVIPSSSVAAGPAQRGQTIMAAPLPSSTTAPTKAAPSAPTVPPAATPPHPAPHPPAPQLTAPPAPQPQPPLNQVMVGSEEHLSRPGATAENAIKPGIEDKVQKFWDKTKADLGGGKWKRKALGLGAVAAGTYGVYRGARALGDYMSTEPQHHTANEGGVVPAYGVNQYGVADRSTPLNY